MIELKPISDPALLAALNRPLHELHVQQHPELFKPYDAAQFRAYFAACLADETFLHLGAFEGNNVLGYVQAQLQHKPENPFAYGYTYVHVHQLQVDKAHRAKGVATRLMDAVHSFAADRGALMTDLTVWHFNRDAQSFYTSLDYAYGLLRMYRRL